MDDDQAMIDSAAAKTFAIPELLEKIILDVVSIEHDAKDPLLESWSLFLSKKSARTFVRSLFILSRVSRDFNNTILGSSKIRNQSLLDISRCKRKSKFDRLIFLGHACGTWELHEHEYGTQLNQIRLNFHNLIGDKLDKSADASWRKIPCVPAGLKRPNAKLEVVEHSIVGSFEMTLRVGFLRIDRTTTLGQVYEKVENMRWELWEHELISMFEIGGRCIFDQEE